MMLVSVFAVSAGLCGVAGCRGGCGAARDDLAGRGGKTPRGTVSRGKALDGKILEETISGGRVRGGKARGDQVRRPYGTQGAGMGAAASCARLGRNIWLIPLHTALNAGLFILPVIVPYYRDRIGLDFHGFMLTEAVFTVVVILMEVPSGWLSDVWGRRRTLMAGSFLFTMGNVLLLVANGFAAAAAAQAVMGVGFSLLSGTNVALLYDTLLALRREGEYRRAEGRRHAMGLYAVGFAAMAGGFLYEVHAVLPLVLTVMLLGASTVLCLLITEPPRARRGVRHHPLADMAQTVRYALRGHREIGAIILLSAAVFGITKTVLWMQQPYYAFLGLHVSWFGVLTAAGCFAGGVAGHLGHLVAGKMRNVTVLLVCAGGMFAACFCAALWPGYHVVPLLLASSMMWGFGWPRVQEAINRRVSSERRATVLSTAGLLIGVVSVPLFVMTGAVTAAGDVTDAFRALALVIALAGAGGALLLYGRTGQAARGV